MRVLPQQSTKEISDRKQALGCELRAALYLYDEQLFIISAIAGIAEYGIPAVINANDPDESIGLAICDKLLEFKPRNERDLSKSKLDDWESYKASGAKTGKYFEQKSVYVYIKTVNSAIEITAAPRISNENNLKALCSVSNGNTHSQIGAAVRKSIQASKVLRSAGML